MALSASTVWEVRSTGSDSNGGGFDPSLGGTDYSKQDTAQATGTVTSASTTVTATTGIFTSVMVGNLITDGTTWKEITAYTSSTIVTVDSAPSWTAASIKVGGGLATPAKANALHVAGNIVYFKSGSTYNLTGNTLTWVATALIGYTTTRGDGGIAVFNGSGMSAAQHAFANNKDHSWWYNLEIDSAIADAFHYTGGRWELYNCIAKSAGVIGFNLNTSFTENCWATLCGSHGFSLAGPGDFACYCTASSNVGNGFNLGSGFEACDRCLSYLNSKGFLGGEAAMFLNCVANGNTSDGFNFNDGSRCLNNISYGNSGYGFNGNTASVMINNSYGSNTSGNINNTPVQSAGGLNQGSILLSGNPFTNSSSGDFSLNNTAGAGAACRAAGFPGVFPGGLTTGYLDIGAAQHQDSGGSTAVFGQITGSRSIGTY